jgi:hypothetical protein
MRSATGGAFDEARNRAYELFKEIKDEEGMNV